jgi:hypothetical protein
MEPDGVHDVRMKLRRLIFVEKYINHLPAPEAKKPPTDSTFAAVGPTLKMAQLLGAGHHCVF